MTVFAARRAQQAPGEIALGDGERALRWAEVDLALNRGANALQALDLGESRRVAVFATNAAETLLAHVIGLLGGASVFPVSFHLTAEEVAYILEDSGTALLFVGPETARHGLEAARLAGVSRVVGWRCDPAGGLIDWQAWLDAGTEGRLYFCDETGRGVVYHNDPEKSAAAHLRPGVFTLGEIGYVDADGYVFITDRFSDMVVSGGVNIYPAESENILIEHPGVSDVACIGVPHPERGEEVKALIIPVDPDFPPDPESLLAFCRERLSHFKCPKSIDFVDTVGRNSMGKVNKKKLRAPWWPNSRRGGPWSLRSLCDQSSAAPGRNQSHAVARGQRGCCGASSG